MTRAFVTGIGGQDGSYLAERLLADGVEVHALTLPEDDPRHCPADVVLHRGDLTDVDGTRRLLARPRAGRGLQPGSAQLGGPLVGAARRDRAGQRHRRGGAARVGVPLPGALRPGLPRGAGLQRRDLRRARPPHRRTRTPRSGR